MSGVCNHSDRPHTVMYWLEDGGPPIPMTASFDTQPEAVEFAESGIRQNNPLLRWIKIFRSDNEAYTCYQWDNPMVERDLSVKIDVDSAPFKKVVDTVADSFDQQSKYIRNLLIGQLLLAIALSAHLISHIL